MNPYEVLGITVDATVGHIKRVYRSMAQIYHPDKPTGDAGRFCAIQAAYDVLSDPERRKRYDATGETEPAPTGAAQSRLIELFNAVIEAGKFSGDIIRDCRAALDQARGNLRAQITELQRKRQLLEKQLGRVVVNADELNLYEGILAGKVEALATHTLQQEAELSLLDEVHDLLGAYSDSAPVATQPAGLAAMQLGGLGHFQQQQGTTGGFRTPNY